MCGIFGCAVSEDISFPSSKLQTVVNELFLLAETRGKEAAGISFITDREINTYKDRQAASRFLRDSDYRQLMDRMSLFGGKGEQIAIIGHSRMVTNGNQEVHENNQPVIGADYVGVHNGIVCNDLALWEKYPEMDRKHQVDSEVIFSLISHFRQKGAMVGDAVERTFAEIEGMASVAGFFADLDTLLLATNNGSLYFLTDTKHQFFAFVSEQYMAECFCRTKVMQSMGIELQIHHLKPGEGLLLDLDTMEQTCFSITDASEADAAKREQSRIIRDIRPKRTQIPKFSVNAALTPRTIRELEQKLEEGGERRAELRRCTRCLLPETMPFIDFDEMGVCNYCHNYSKLKFYGREALETALVPHRKVDGSPHCIVGLSGGRDSTYALHYVVKELDLKAVAYTYDWGMVTDLARRNISRICAQLGVEHVLVSADIPRKRNNIRKNVLAWLKRPRLGMVPLFMAGDKQYFYFAQKLKDQMDIDLVVLGENMLERTDFKTGYCGIRPHTDKNHVYTLRAKQKTALALYYGKEYLLNPAYFNQSLTDSIWAFGCYYFTERTYLNLFKYIPWDEKTVNSTLIGEYGWETATDAQSTWRIGDGTASFYNYIYYVISGFSEHETFRSNQIREGALIREEALRLAERDNRPRWETIHEYCNTIGIDFRESIDAINHAPRLY